MRTHTPANTQTHTIIHNTHTYRDACTRTHMHTRDNSFRYILAKDISPDDIAAGVTVW